MIRPVKWTRAAALATTVLFLSPVLAQDTAAPAAGKPADNMQIMLEKVRADKKLLVANNMKLTEQEATGFWPLYEGYQKELQALNGRLEKVIKQYAEAYNAGTAIPDATAKQMWGEFLAIQEGEVQLQRSYVTKLEKVLPMNKVVRYLQLETKVRSAIKYDMAKRIPLVE